MRLEVMVQCASTTQTETFGKEADKAATSKPSCDLGSGTIFQFGLGPSGSRFQVLGPKETQEDDYEQVQYIKNLIRSIPGPPALSKAISKKKIAGVTLSPPKKSYNKAQDGDTTHQRISPV